MLCSGNTAATYTNLRYCTKVTIIDAQYRNRFIRVLLLDFDQWLLDLKLQAKSLQGILLLFLEDRDDFDNKVETFYNPTLKKVNVTIDGDPHQLFQGSDLTS